MKNKEYIAVTHIISHYGIEVSFIDSIFELGLIEIITIENENFVSTEQLVTIEKIIRINQDLDLNVESIEVIINLLNKIENLQSELNDIKNKLKFYE